MVITFDAFRPPPPPPTCLHFSKSNGLADIPARLLKDASGAIARPLTVLINRSLTEGSIPWKHATVTPVHKSDSRTNPANYI